MQTGRPFHKFKMLKMKKVGRDQGMKLTMLWCSHIAIPLISRNVAFRFLRQPGTPKPPRPVAKRGSVARIVVATSGATPEISVGSTVNLNFSPTRMFALGQKRTS
jgi:hypothetical protein